MKGVSAVVRFQEVQRHRTEDSCRKKETVYSAHACTGARLVMACQMNRAWECTLCSTFYCDLSSAVSHIRDAHSSDPGLAFSCSIQGCPPLSKVPAIFTGMLDMHIWSFTKRNSFRALHYQRLFVAIQTWQTVMLIWMLASSLTTQSRGMNLIQKHALRTVTSSADAAEGPASVAAGFLLHFKGKQA